MEPTPKSREDFRLTTDLSALSLDDMYELLATTHWAHLRPRSVVETSIAHSLVFGILHGRKQIAMARVVTDYASFAWVCDVVVKQEFQGRGLGRWLMSEIETHPALARVRRYLLCTKTAEGLYAKLGYSRLPDDPTTWMIRRFPERETHL